MDSSEDKGGEVMKRLIIILALLFTTSAQADIDLKGFKLGMTYDEWRSNPNIIDKTMSEYTEDNQPIKCLKPGLGLNVDLRNPCSIYFGDHKPLDYAIVTLLDTKMFLKSEFDTEGKVSSLWFSTGRPVLCMGWSADKIYQDYFKSVDYDIGKKCGDTKYERKESNIPPVTMWQKAFGNKFNSRVDFQHNVNPENGREWTNLLMVEYGIRLQGTVAEDLASVQILSNDEYLKKQADHKKWAEELEQKTISDL